VPITFINPSLKLKDMPRPAEGKTTYRENKLYAISKATECVSKSECINKDECSKLFIEKKIKKDDLADAFLQGLIAGQMYCKGLVIVDEEPKKKVRAKKVKEDIPKVETEAKVETKDPEPEKPVKSPKKSVEENVKKVPVSKTKKRKVDESV
jgi:hypothetical protein